MKDMTFTVDSVHFLTDTIFELQLCSGEDLPVCRAGQFLHLKIPGQDAMLRRPFCLYQFSKRSISLLIAVAGKGTAMLARLKRGDTVQAIVPIGNGFILKKNQTKIALLGGGVGCAPLLMVAKDNPGAEVRAYLGFASDSPVRIALEMSFSADSQTTVATEDGSYGFQGYSTDAFLKDYHAGYRPDLILTCGTEPMIKSVVALSHKLQIPGYASAEARMGCGVGACLVCTCAVKGTDGVHHNKRVCIDGPVFALEDLVL